ncbi:MAG: beta-galactosidase BgaS [Thermoprotei archaeon]|jgi:beta-galactosidase
MQYHFPNNFLFGFSESGFQFEMGVSGSEDPNSDWWIWVHNEENIFSRIVSGDFPEDGPAYWHFYKQDHNIAQNLGMNAARLGIEWSRIFPKPTFDIKIDVEEDNKGNILRIDVNEKALEALDKIANKEALNHYREIFNDWKSRDNTLIINLYHWPLPIWLHEPIMVRRFGPDRAPSGWLDKKSVVEFVKFVAYIAWKLGDYPDMWSTMTEPNVVYGSGYVDIKSGFPPGYLSIDSAINAAKHLAEAHARAYDVLKEISKKPIGIIHAVFAIEPLKFDENYVEAAEKAKKIEVYDFLDLITSGESFFIGERKDLSNRLDWIGINYYSRIVVRPIKYGMGFEVIDGYGLYCSPNGVSKDGKPCSDMGWEVYPEGLYSVLIDFWKRYKIPLMVTENGIADAEDRLRPKFLVSHMLQLQKAINSNVDLRGYFHWALTDNYEWAHGFKMRFGLVHVDYKTKKRYIRPSALIFRDLVKYREISEFAAQD